MPGRYDSDITVADLETLGHLLPVSALALVYSIGPQIAAALMSKAPGEELSVPSTHDHDNDHTYLARKSRERLAEIVGAPDMPRLVAAFGGATIEVPRCHGLRREKTNRWMRARVEQLAAGPRALSGEEIISRLVQEMGLGV